MKYKVNKQALFNLHFYDDEELDHMHKIPSWISAYKVAKKSITMKLAVIGHSPFRCSQQLFLPCTEPLLLGFLASVCMRWCRTSWPMIPPILLKTKSWIQLLSLSSSQPPIQLCHKHLKRCYSTLEWFSPLNLAKIHYYGCYGIRALTQYPLYFPLSWWSTIFLHHKIPCLSRSILEPPHIHPQYLIPLDRTSALDTLLCFTFFILICFAPPPALRSAGFHFHILYAFLFKFQSCSAYHSAALFCSSNIIPLLFLDFLLDSSLLGHYLSYWVTQFPLISHFSHAALYSI